MYRVEPAPIVVTLFSREGFLADIASMAGQDGSRDHPHTALPWSLAPAAWNVFSSAVRETDGAVRSWREYRQDQGLLRTLDCMKGLWGSTDGTGPMSSGAPLVTSNTCRPSRLGSRPWFGRSLRMSR